MTKAETIKIKMISYVRIRYDDAVADGILIENYSDSDSVKVFFPKDNEIENVQRDQIYKYGKLVEFDFKNSGLWK